MARAVILALYLSVAWAAPSGKDLLDALRDGDSAQVRRMIQAGAPVTAVDDFDSSALMYAALYADLHTVRFLLDKGSDPNHADKSGATALMWAIPDEAKVRLLIDRGAQVNAVSPSTGRTPLLIAAGRPGAARIVRMLLDKGADPKARDKNGESAIFRAAFNGDAAVVKLLADRGADIDAPGRGVTPLLEAISGGNTSVIDLLLARGANAKAQDQDGFGALASACSFGEFSVFRKLIAAGADPKLRSPDGIDFLMMAAASDTSRPEFIQEVVKLGLDPKIRIANLHTKHGFGKDPESPLDWASRQGDTPVARLLVKLTGEQPRGEAAAEGQRLGASSPREAIAKALPPLYDGGREFFKNSGCTSCHHNSLPAIAFSLARSKGIALDEEKVKRNYLQSVAWITGNQEGLLQDVRLPGGDTTAAYVLWSFEADRRQRDRSTDALVHYLAGSQSLDGGWRVRADRPPIESGRVTPTAITIRALRAYPIPGRKAQIDARIRRAAKWLAAYTPRTGEEKSMRLLGLVWAGARIQDAASQLASTQRKDGGWAQLDGMPSDAYATGQALFALHTAGHLSADQLRQGVRFLLDTQLADGTWHVRSRAYPIQSKYFDTGFPHGRDQWISAAGTSWASAALSLAVDR